MRVVAYPPRVPKLWNETLDEHRREVRDAILDTAGELGARHGLRALTMSQIAEQAGIGRATLYKYFAGVDAILVAWHERQIGAHLRGLEEIAAQAADAGARLDAVLEAYAHMSRHNHDGELAAALHEGAHAERARQQLHDLVADLLAAAADAGDVRDDVPADELASYCLHALQAAGGLTSKAAVGRLVSVTLAGVRRRAPG